MGEFLHYAETGKMFNEVSDDELVIRATKDLPKLRIKKGDTVSLKQDGQTKKLINQKDRREFTHDGDMGSDFEVLSKGKKVMLEWTPKFTSGEMALAVDIAADFMKYIADLKLRHKLAGWLKKHEIESKAQFEAKIMDLIAEFEPDTAEALEEDEELKKYAIEKIMKLMHKYNKELGEPEHDYIDNDDEEEEPKENLENVMEATEDEENEGMEAFNDTTDTPLENVPEEEPQPEEVPVTDAQEPVVEEINPLISMAGDLILSMNSFMSVARRYGIPQDVWEKFMASYASMQNALLCIETCVGVDQPCMSCESTNRISDNDLLQEAASRIL